MTDAGHGAGRDPGAGTRIPLRGGAPSGDALGSYQEDMLKSHTHEVPIFQSDATTPLNTPSITRSNTNLNLPTPNQRTTDATGGNETRPKNVNVFYIIKE